MSHSRLFLVHFSESNDFVISSCAAKLWFMQFKWIHWKRVSRFDGSRIHETKTDWIYFVDVSVLFIHFVYWIRLLQQTFQGQIDRKWRRTEEAKKTRRIRAKPWLWITCLVRIWRDRHWIIIIINYIIMLAAQCWRGVWLWLASLCLYCQFSIVSYATS